MERRTEKTTTDPRWEIIAQGLLTYEGNLRTYLIDEVHSRRVTARPGQRKTVAVTIQRCTWELILQFSGIDRGFETEEKKVNRERETRSQKLSNSWARCTGTCLDLAAVGVDA